MMTPWTTPTKTTSTTVARHTANSMRLNRAMRDMERTLIRLAATVSSTAASAAVGRYGSRRDPRNPTISTMVAATRPTTCDFPFAVTVIAVRGGEALTAKAPTSPATADATPMAPRSRSRVRRSPGKDASVAPVWMTMSTAMTRAVGSTATAAAGVTDAKSRAGGARSGKGSVTTPLPSKSAAPVKAIAAASPTSAPGTRGPMSRAPRVKNRTMPATATVHQLISSKLVNMSTMPPMTLPPCWGMPRATGSWSTMMPRPMPASRPMVTGRDRNWVIQPPRINPTASRIAPTSTDVSIRVSGWMTGWPDSVSCPVVATPVMAPPAAAAASSGAMEESAPTDSVRWPPSRAKTTEPTMKAIRPAMAGAPTNCAVPIEPGSAMAASVRPASASPGSVRRAPDKAGGANRARRRGGPPIPSASMAMPSI